MDAACDFFVVRTLTLRMLFRSVVRSLTAGARASRWRATRPSLGGSRNRVGERCELCRCSADCTIDTHGSRRTESAAGGEGSCGTGLPARATGATAKTGHRCGQLARIAGDASLPGQASAILLGCCQDGVFGRDSSYCVHDGKALPIYDSFINDGITLSADGMSAHLLVNRGEHQLGVLAGEETAEFFGAVALTVSTRGDGVAFIATKDELPRRARLFFRGELGPGFDAIEGLTLSLDGSRAAYVGLAGDDIYVVVGDTRLGPYAGLGGITFSEDGSRHAFVAADDEGVFQVVDGERQRSYHEVGEAVFSADGNHVAYRARLNDATFLVVDGWEADFVFSRLASDEALAAHGSSGFRCAYQMFNGRLNIAVVERFR